MVKYLDCTIRDGGYLNNWNFSFKYVYRLLRVLDESGFDYAEIGFWNPQSANQLWKHCSIETLKALKAEELKIKLVLIMDFGSCEESEIPQELQNYIGLIRIASHKKDLGQAIELAGRLTQRGFKTTINAMGITSYDQKDLVQLAKYMQEAEKACEFFYVADSFGGLTPDETAKLFHFLASVVNYPLGFHPHNNMELALANSLAAIGAGAQIVDSSLLGLGRGGGNLRSELIAAVNSKSPNPTLDPLPLLSFADATFDKIGNELGLAYDLEQVISGLAKCHPNYASGLIGPRRLALDEVFKVIESIPASQKSKFSETILEEVIEGYNSSVTTTGIEIQALNSSKDTGKAILVCPGPYDTSISFDAPVYSVNFKPEGVSLKGVIFGSLRRLWQVGDSLESTPGYFISHSTPLHSLPDSIIINTSFIKKRLGKMISNSGIRAIASLLEAGYSSVEVYGMAGFKGEGESSSVFKHMEKEATEELNLVVEVYSKFGKKITIN